VAPENGCTKGEAAPNQLIILGATVAALGNRDWTSAGRGRSRNERVRICRPFRAPGEGRVRGAS
jgi:hypothetical protein